MPKESGGKWKDALLKTSLPLELLVAEKLDAAGFWVSGEYTYLRTNESGADTEFSVDISAFRLLSSEVKQWGQLELLVECKYNYPGVKWVFAPVPNRDAVEFGLISLLQDLCTSKISRDVLYDVDRELTYCMRGVELHANDANPQSIKHGADQLRYALPDKAMRVLVGQALEQSDEFLSASLLCPILVTTSSLHILHTGMSLQDFQGAKDMSDISDETDALIISQEPGRHMSSYVLSVMDKLRAKVPEVDTRFDCLRSIIDESREHQARAMVTLTLNERVLETTQRILVVTYPALGKWIELIHRLAVEAGSSLQRYAALHRDIDTRSVAVVPIVRDP